MAATALAAVAAILAVPYAAVAFEPGEPQEARQEEVAQRGAAVMPFDLEETTHVFEKTQTGGVQEVVADDPNDTEQVALVRGHLEEEAAAFRRGDLSDPALVRVLRGWFDAQLSDHGPQAAKDGQYPAEGGGHATDRAQHGG